MIAVRRKSPGGIFAQVVSWMLIPLVVIWPLVILATYFAAGAIAEATFDRALRDMTRAVAEEAKLAFSQGGRTSPLPVLDSLRNDPVDRLFVQLARPDGSVLAGDSAVPMQRDGATQEVSVRDGRIDGEPVRIAHTIRVVGGVDLHIQVADPLKRRSALVSQVTSIVMGVLVLIVPVSVALAWFGIWHGLRPLRALQERLERRRPDDISPIPSDAVPAEIAPLIAGLNGQLERVDRSLQSQKRFIADAAHQMKTPLAGLKVLAESALREESVEEVRQRLERIEESADRMSRLVAQLLALARADDADVVAPPDESVELNGLLKEVCESWADRAISQGVSLGYDAAPASAVVRGSPLLLRELFGNLVDNAIRYTPAGGEVAVRVAAGPPATVTVQDSGPGIPEGERDLVFERFHRVLGAGGSGSGLGLSIVKAIAGLHGARIRLEPGPSGTGTRMIVAFS